jgi:hypothetical protein
VSESVGVRVVLVHAKDEKAKRFYERYGFVVSRIDPLTLMILVTLSSDANDADEITESGEVVGVAGVERKIVRVSGGGDEQVGNTPPV